MSPEEWLASQSPRVAPTAAPPVAAKPNSVGAMSPEEWEASQSTKPMGFFEGLAEQVTGRARATPETQTLPEWTGMPELNQMSLASFKTGLGTLLSNPKETVQILQANFPGVQVRQDQKGNYILRSSVDQKEYAIPPGFTAGDIPRAIGGALAFTPAGRATTIPGAILAGGATQAAIEASQAATGGGTGAEDLAEVGMAAALGPAGQVVQRVAQPVAQAVKGVAQKVMGRAPAAAVPEAVQTVAPAAVVQKTTAATTAAQTAPEEITSLVQKASGKGIGSASARDRLADLAQIDTEAKAAANRLGIELPADVFSDNPQIRAAAGLTRSVAGGEAEAAWRNTVRDAVEKADDVIRKYDASFVEGTVSPGAVSQKIKDALIQQQKDIAQSAKDLYGEVDKVVPKKTKVTFPGLKAKLADMAESFGEQSMQENPIIRKLTKMVDLAEAGKVPYGRLIEVKALIGESIKGAQNDYSKSLSQGRLKDIYGALAQDQLDNVERLASPEVRKQLRSANLLTAKEKALGKRIVNAFGQDVEGSVANKMRLAITSAAKGDTGEFNRLLKTVPEELRRETVATALASATRSAKGSEKGGFGFSEFAGIYPKIRANPQVYKTIVETLGSDAALAMRDLYSVSKRITEARANVLTTGKANQAFANPEGLIGKVMENSIAQRAATAAVGLVPGGGAVAPDIIKFMSQGAEERVKAAGKLFADESFQKLAIEAATKAEPSAATLRKAAMSQSFQRYADAIKLPKPLNERLKWLQSGLQAGRMSNQEEPQRIYVGGFADQQEAQQ
jgi:hypothetical protein